MLLIKKLIILILLSSSIFFTESKAEDKFLSLKNNIVNVRHQPTGNSQIKYIYKKINLPVKQIDKKENYSRIIDLKNNSGWIHSSQLKPSNSIIILEDKILFKEPSNFSKPIVRLEEGRLLVINKCKKDWCSIKTDDYSGWVKTNNIWGSIK